MLHSSKPWWFLKKPVVGWHWWLWKELVVVCGKWNVRQATLQQMFKVTTYCTGTCFQSFLPLINCIIHHALLKFNPCRNKTLLQLVRITDWYSMCVKKWKRWKICAFYKVVRWHFSGVVGKRITVCFFWDNLNNLKCVWIILLKNDFFGFSKVKWLQCTGEVGKCTSCRCQIFWGFNTPKIIKIGKFLTELFEK